ncbi:hypothetical protein DFH09DRAFT_1285588 [Mycena vulgaris]|nr:hypothetical protein DFH09DRAFT_1285588 [Mycena vulgaris]
MSDPQFLSLEAQFTSNKDVQLRKFIQYIRAFAEYQIIAHYVHFEDKKIHFGRPTRLRPSTAAVPVPSMCFGRGSTVRDGMPFTAPVPPVKTGTIPSRRGAGTSSPLPLFSQRDSLFVLQVSRLLPASARSYSLLDLSADVRMARYKRMLVLVRAMVTVYIATHASAGASHPRLPPSPTNVKADSAETELMRTASTNVPLLLASLPCPHMRALNYPTQLWEQDRSELAVFSLRIRP